MAYEALMGIRCLCDIVFPTCKGSNSVISQTAAPITANWPGKKNHLTMRIEAKYEQKLIPYANTSKAI